MAAANDGYSGNSVSSQSDSRQSSPTDSTTFLQNGNAEQRRYEVKRWVFASPEPHFHSSSRRYQSPRHHFSRPGTPPVLTRSLSEDVGMNIAHWRTESHLNNSPPISTSMLVNQQAISPTSNNFRADDHQRHPTPVPSRPESRRFTASVTSQGSSSGHFRTASILSDIRPPVLTRSSTRRSFGREWTRSHWEKVREIEQESERARRCSKLSSGFAPLMVFGGLVFICIGVSAATNTGADKERLKKLSAAPMAMGVFMLTLGIFLVGSWFGCRGRARGLEQRLLHGSRRNSFDDNLVQNLIAKLSASAGANRRQSPSPSLPGVTLDGVDVLKPQPDKEVRRQGMEDTPCPDEANECCSHCGASSTSTTQVVIETSI